MYGRDPIIHCPIWDTLEFPKGELVEMIIFCSKSSVPYLLRTMDRKSLSECLAVRAHVEGAKH